MTARVFVFILGLTVWLPGLAVAQTTDNATKPVAPGGIRVMTKAPEPDKWDAQRNANGTQRVFKCKPLACSDQQIVSFTFMKSPTRHPDPKALEKFAKEDLPKSLRAANAAREVLSDGTEKLETLESKTATLKNYPSVLNESKITRGKREAYIETAIIFAGPMMIRVQSSSPDRALAKKALTDFVDVMQVEEGPPPSAQPPSSPLSPPSIQGT